jgi:hypothetical protein
MALREIEGLSINPEPFDRFKALSLSKGIPRVLDRGVEWVDAEVLFSSPV